MRPVVITRRRLRLFVSSSGIIVVLDDKSVSLSSLLVLMIRSTTSRRDSDARRHRRSPRRVLPGGSSNSPSHQLSNPSPDVFTGIPGLLSRIPPAPSPPPASARRTPSASEKPSSSTTDADEGAIDAGSPRRALRCLVTVHVICAASRAAIIAIAVRGDGGRPPCFASDAARYANTMVAPPDVPGGRRLAARNFPARRARPPSSPGTKTTPENLSRRVSVVRPPERPRAGGSARDRRRV